MKITKIMLLGAVAALSTASQAVILITNATANSATLGSQEITAIGNSATLLSGSAVGDGFPLRSGIIAMQYDARSTGANIGSIKLNLRGIATGSGSISVIEDVFAIDALGNETGFLQSFSFTSAPNAGNFLASRTFNLTTSSQAIRVKKTIFLEANPNTQGNDSALLSFVNQSVEPVPEPASMLALAGAAAMVARRRKSK